MRSRLFSIVCVAYVGFSVQQSALADELYDAVLAGKAEAVHASIAAGADPNQQGNVGTPLHIAAATGDVAIIRILLEAGADIEAVWKSNGGRPLHQAVSFDHPEAVLFLLAKGARIDAHDAQQRTPLGLAARAGNLPLAKILIDRGADVNEPGYVRKPLHWAAMSGNVELLQLMLDHEADMNALASTGETPLHLAAGAGDVASIKILVARGARLNARDLTGVTPLMLAESSMHPEAAAALRALGATE